MTQQKTLNTELLERILNAPSSDYNYSDVHDAIMTIAAAGHYEGWSWNIGKYDPIEIAEQEKKEELMNEFFYELGYMTKTWTDEDDGYYKYELIDPISKWWHADHYDCMGQDLNCQEDCCFDEDEYDDED